MHKFTSRLISLFVLIFSVTDADLSQHFKKAEGKSDNHTMRNIDFIYLINLDQRPQKFQKTVQQLHPYGIYPYRFSAVNGYALTLEQLNEIGLKLTETMKKGKVGIYYAIDPATGFPMPHKEKMKQIGRTYFAMNNGGIGCGLSHLSILQDALDSNYETVWIMEDDIEVVKDPRIISDLIDELDRLVGKGNWDVLYTDIDRKNDDGTYMPCKGAPGPERPNYSPPNPARFAYKQVISPNLRKVGSRYGLHSYIVRRSGMEKILNFIKLGKLFMHIDQDIYVVPGISLYTTTEDVVSHITSAHSDSQNAWDLLNPQIDKK